MKSIISPSAARPPLFLPAFRVDPRNGRMRVSLHSGMTRSPSVEREIIAPHWRSPWFSSAASWCACKMAWT